MARRRPSFIQDLIWRLEAFGFDALGLLFKLLPIEAASSLGAAALRLLGPLTDTHRIAERNIRIAFPRMDKAARDRLLDSQWDNLGRLTAEFQLMHKLTPGSGRVEIVGGERLRAGGGLRQAGGAGVGPLLQLGGDGGGDRASWRALPGDLPGGQQPLY